MIDFERLVNDFINDYLFAINSNNKFERISGYALAYIFIVWCFPVWGSQLVIEFIRKQNKKRSVKD